VLGRLDLSILGPQTLSPVPTILEGEAFKVTLRALSADLAVATPSTARYRIDDEHQNSPVLDWTTITPATLMSFIVTSAQNAMRNGMGMERRQLIVEATDSDGALRRVIDYDIQDIAGLS
jgi:hypothetical protein